MDTVSVLIVARPGDEHGDQVEEAILSRGERVGRLSLNTFRTVGVEWEPGGPLHIESSNDSFLVGSASTIWWRRPGWAEVDDLEPEEAEFIESENRVMLDGLLMACDARWVDHPLAVQRGENKLFQLAIASTSAVSIPRSKVTNSEVTARQLATQSTIVAKSVSVGDGIAPFVDEVPEELIEKVRSAPVLLQERIEASEDLRIVTVGHRAFTWSRERGVDDPIDWRRQDPEGRGFEHISRHDAEEPALGMAGALGLTHSSQDWLVTSNGPVFLEANPGGQWLFLSGAFDLIVPALVDHLCGNDS
jgi:hypothetical protein